MLFGAIDFCAKSANIWQFVGYILLVFKIVIPILLIIWGMIDLGKAVVASKDEDIKKATKSLALRFVAALVVYFLPTLVGVVFSIVNGFSGEVENDYNNCKVCITNPNGSACKGQSGISG